MNPIKIPYEDLKRSNQKYKLELKEIASSVIDSGWYILGDNVQKFENAFARENESNFCLGVASGLDALILGLCVFDFPIGSKILVPSNTYIATILAIIRSGLVPVLVEPNVDTCNIDIEGVKNSYSEECVGIIVVHLYGRLCEMDRIVQFADEKGMRIIEDCAQSHFAESDSIKAGNFGDIGAFSFYPTKNLGALGDAGAIVCKSEDVYLKLKSLRNYGSHLKYHNNYIGWNSRLDEIQAAFLLVKLNNIEHVINRKREIANLYLQLLEQIDDLKLPVKSSKNNVWHIFNIRLKQRDKLRAYLLEKGVGTEIHYPVAPSDQIAYKSLFNNDSHPVSRKIHAETLSLPISFWLTDDEVKYISNCIIQFLTKSKSEIQTLQII